MMSRYTILVINFSQSADNVFLLLCALLLSSPLAWKMRQQLVKAVSID